MRVFNNREKEKYFEKFHYFAKIVYNIKLRKKIVMKNLFL